MLRATGNDLCNGCHLADLVKPAADGTIVLPGGAVLAPAFAKGLSRIALDTTRTKGHPQRNHPVAGIAKASRNPLAKTIAGKEMTCTSCHSPHSGKSGGLFVGGAATQAQLCLSCHPK